MNDFSTKSTNETATAVTEILANGLGTASLQKEGKRWDHYKNEEINVNVTRHHIIILTGTKLVPASTPSFPTFHMVRMATGEYIPIKTQKA